MCDAAYLCQVETIERDRLAQVALLPHMEEKARKEALAADMRAEFDEWLVSVPEQELTAADAEQDLMYRFLGVGRKG